MSKYPYIGKGSLSEAILLFIATGEALVLEQEKTKYPQHVKGIEESLFRNITIEYLESTYGEVKSIGHAEFIKKLCFKNGIKTNNFDAIEKGKSFNIGGGIIMFSMLSVKDLVIYNKRKITIPLPPEKNKNLVDINDFKCSGCNVPICPVCSKLGKAPIKHFDCVCKKCGGRCCIGNCDERPKPGDEVLVSEKPGVTIHESHKEIFGAKDLTFIGKFKNSYGKEIAVIQNEKGACFVVISKLLEKPKTPEQELYDEMERIINSAMASVRVGHGFHVASFLDGAIGKYNITKKVKDND